jgi:hypothetical protein
VGGGALDRRQQGLDFDCSEGCLEQDMCLSGVATAAVSAGEGLGEVLVLGAGLHRQSFCCSSSSCSSARKSSSSRCDHGMHQLSRRSHDVAPLRP